MKKKNSIAQVSIRAGEMTRKVLKRLCDQVPRYVPPPPKDSYTVLVRYVYRGRDKPLPYPLDDSAGERGQGDRG